MKVVTCPVTSSGVVLTDPEQGFIIQGNIFVAGLGEDGKPTGGLFGRGGWIEECVTDESKIPLVVVTKEEMLDGLGFTPEEVEAWAQKEKNRARVVVMSPGEEFVTGEVKGDGWDL